MALYNLTKVLDKERFKKRCNHLYKKGCEANGDFLVELSERKPLRTTEQNDYLHLLLSCFALEYKDTKDWVKEEYYKKIVNRDIYVYTFYDPVKKAWVERTRSSKELTTEEMSISIDRFKKWAAENGIYLPDANKPEEIVQAYQATENYKQYL